MDIKLPSGLSPNKKKLIKRLFNQWKDHLYEGGKLNTILTENHIFIDGINLIPIKFFGQCKIYREDGSFQYEGGYMLEDI